MADQEDQYRQEPTPQHPAPTYALTVAGKDITPFVDARLISLTLTEGRENTADQLDLELSDHDGLLELPRKEAEIELSIGWPRLPLPTSPRPMKATCTF